MPRPSCFICEAHCVRRALDLAEASAGSNNAARIAMMAMTTSNSIKVKPLTVHEDDFPFLADRIFFSLGWRWNIDVTQGDELFEIAIELAADHRVVQLAREVRQGFSHFRIGWRRVTVRMPFATSHDDER